MPDEIETLVEQTQRFAKNMEAGRREAEGLHLSISKVAFLGAGFHVMKEALDDIIRQSTLVQSLKRAISSDSLDFNKLLDRQMVLESDITALTYKAGVQRLDLLNQQERMRYEGLVMEARSLETQQRFAMVLREVGKVQVGLFIGVVGLMGDMLAKSRQLNQDLIEANAGYAHRWRLVQATLLTQVQLGASFGKVTESARALVHYGLDTSASFRNNLRIVTQMSQGLEVSTHAAAMLATVVERQVKGSFESVANVIAQLVDDTALAGEEATKLATAISQAMGRLGPGVGAAGLPEVVKLVGRYESALKEVGGAPGAFEELIARLTTPEGITGAGALNVTPDFLSTARGVQDVIDRFSQYGRLLVGQSRGWERQMRLDALANQFSISAQSANQMILAIDRANQQTVGSISLHERWRRQVHATDQGVSRLFESFVGLSEGALYPAIWAINGVVNALADGLQWVTKHTTLAYIAMAGIGTGMVAMAISMARVTKALWTVVVTSNFAAAAAQRLAAAQAVQAATGGVAGATGISTGVVTMLRTTLFSGFSSITRTLLWLPRLIAGATLTVASLATAALIGAVLSLGAILWRIHYWNRKAVEDSIEARRIVYNKQQILEQARQAAIAREARYGTPAAVGHQQDLLLRDTLVHLRSLQPADRIAEIQREIAEQDKQSKAIAQVLAARSLLGAIGQRPEPEDKLDTEVRETSIKHMTIARQQLTLMQKEAEQEQARQAEEEVERAKTQANRIRGYRWQ